MWSILFSDDYQQAQYVILYNFRLPKAFTAILSGIALSISGLQMQTIFRNPLAGPYVLGISSGASLGVAIVVMGMSWVQFVFHTTIVNNWLIIMAAWIGSGAVLFTILLVSIRIRDIMTILILGILFGAVSSSLVTVLQYFSQESLLKTFVLWTMGNLGGVTQQQLQILAPCIGIGVILTLLSTKTLNALLLGENYAKSMGVNVQLSRIIIFFSTSLLAGSITAFCGPIGFIGIAVPHIARLVFRTANHGVLLWGTMLIGAIIMLFSDIATQLPPNNKMLPINSVTALIGIPVIVYIIIKNKKMW